MGIACVVTSKAVSRINKKVHKASFELAEKNKQHKGAEKYFYEILFSKSSSFFPKSSAQAE